MKNKPVNQIKIGSLLSYFQMGLSIIIGLIYTPIMIKLLGQNEYGLYQTVASAISMLSLLSLGFNSGYIKYYSQYNIKKDSLSIAKLNGLFLIIFTIIGIVALLSGLYISFNLSFIFDSGLTISEYKTAKVLMILLTINLAFSFPASVFSNIISAHEKFVFLKAIGMIRTVFGPLVTLPILLLGYRSIAMVVITVSISLIVDVVYICYVLFGMQEKFIFKHFEKGLIKRLFIYTIFIAINLLIDQINWNIDKLIIGRFKGTAEVAIYSVGYSLNSYYQMFSTSVSGVFTPRVHEIVQSSLNDISTLRSRLTSLFVRVGRIQFIILGLIATGIVFFGDFFITKIWVDENYNRSYYVTLLLILPVTIPLIQNIGIEIQRAQNKHQFRSIAYAIMAVINILMSIYLCKSFGAVGSAVGTAISLIVANGVVMNFYYHRKCNIDIIVFWKNILQLSLGLIVPMCVGTALLLFVEIKGIFMFLLCIIGYTSLYCLSMWFLGMNDYERDLIRVPLSKILRRKTV